jgi:hypothetical protein
MASTLFPSKKQNIHLSPHRKYFTSSFINILTYYIKNSSSCSWATCAPIFELLWQPVASLVKPLSEANFSYGRSNHAILSVSW